MHVRCFAALWTSCTVTVERDDKTKNMAILTPNNKNTLYCGRVRKVIASLVQFSIVRPTSYRPCIAICSGAQKAMGGVGGF